MTLHVDVKYANLLSSRLLRYKVLSHNPFKANFRCPFCGDSEKSQFKARGFFLQYDDHITYKCHNCGLPTNLQKVLEKVDPLLYKEYILESFGDKDKKKVVKTETFKHPTHMRSGSPLLKLKKISQLPNDHFAKQYVLDRKIPTRFHAKLFFAPKFAEWTNSIIPDKLKTDNDKPRLIIPFLDRDGHMFGYQGRSFDPTSKAKYKTIMIEDKPRVFGLDELDDTKKHYLVEGPIDSMFLPNAIAMAGADADFYNENTVFVYDNEPRNPEIVSRYAKVLDQGHKIVIWPDNMEFKDINDMILGGMSAQKVVDIIDANTYNGIIGMMRFTQWKKI